MDRLKLIALDRDDIEVVSAHLQDAVVKAADIHWRPAEKRLVVGAQPVRLGGGQWRLAGIPPPPRGAALRAGARPASAATVDAAEKDQVLNLLAVVFEETDPPAGVVTLTFSGGAALRLEVECLEAELADLGPAWVTECLPGASIDRCEPPQTPAERRQTGLTRLAGAGH